MATLIAAKKKKQALLANRTKALAQRGSAPVDKSKGQPSKHPVRSAHEKSGDFVNRGKARIAHVVLPINPPA
jgi:hypothetical protein